MGLTKSLITIVCSHHWELFFSIIILLITYQFFIYPFVLNPLHKIPGPLSYKISSIFILNDQRIEQRNVKVDKWHQKYGSVVQIGPNEISLSSLDDLKKIYIQKNLPKSSFYAQFVNFNEKNAFSIQDSQEHLKRKKLMTKRYTKTSIFTKSSQDHLNQKTNNVIQFIQANKSSPMDVYELFNSLAMDVVTFYEFGPKWASDLILDQPTRDIIKSFRASSSMWFYTTLLPSLWSWVASKEVAELSDQSREWTERKFLKAYEYLETNGPDPEDQSLCRTLYDLGLPKYAIASEMFDHVAAGHETTGTTLAYLTWELSRPNNQYIQEKLHEELKSVGGINNSVDLETIDKLEYLNAIILETERVHAAIPGAEPREITNSLYEVQLSNGETVKLPKGTIVSVQPYTIHRSSVFSKPDIFIPERWLQQPGESSEDFKKRFQLMSKHIFTFGQGNRMCLGMNLAVIEMKLVVAKMYWHYNSRISTSWCSNISNSKATITGYSAFKNKNKSQLTDVELMSMADSYTSRPIHDECWLEWTEKKTN